MAHDVELNPYEHAKCVQIYGWKCLICSVEAKDQVGLELQHIADGVVYIDSINGTKWVCCQKYKKTNHVACVCPNQPSQQNGPFCVAFLSANSKRVRVDLHVKWVITKRVPVSVVVVKQKKGKPRPPKEEHQGKDSRIINPRREASSGKNKKEQNWSEKDLDRAFDMWEQNPDLPPQERKSKRQISMETGIPYTTLCERLSGRRGGRHHGKIAGGKHQARILDTGKCKRVTVTFQVSNCNCISA